MKPKIHRLISTADTNLTIVSAKPSDICKLLVSNSVAGIRYIHFYDQATAPASGQTSPAPIATLEIPGNSAGVLVSLSFADGLMPFDLGIAYSITTGSADSDTGVLSAGDVIVHTLYYPR